MNSVEKVREAFFEAGISVSGWARDRGFRPENVYAVLAGRAKGRRGESHRIALALGLKAKAASIAIELLTETSPSRETTQVAGNPQARREEDSAMS